MRFANLTLATLFVMASSAVQAQLATFDLSYSGAQFNDNAVATGTITLDESVLNNPGGNQQTVNPFVTALNLTVSGAISGNGTFTLSDFSNVLLNISSPLDLSKELVGQPGLSDFNVFNVPGNIAPGWIYDVYGWSQWWFR